MMASLLASTCKEFVLLTHLMAQANGVERVYLGGSFINNDYVRRIITRNIIVTKAMHMGQVRFDYIYDINSDVSALIAAFV